MKKWKIFYSFLLVAVILLQSSIGVGLNFSTHVWAADMIVRNVSVDKARYAPADPVTISVILGNSAGTAWSGTLTLKSSWLDTSVWTTTRAITLNAGETRTESFTWTTPATDFRGYLLQASVSTADFRTTAVDVSSNWTKYPRYGYVPEFAATETAADSQKKIKDLTRNFHINAFQFYDWMWRHDKNFKRTNGVVDSTWQDLFGRTISWSTIQNQISAVHAENAKAMAYQMSYASRENYENQGVNSQWGLYSDRNHANQLNVDFGNNQTYLYMFNPADSGWKNYMINEYKDAINTAAFDGLQIDQMGQRDNTYDYFGRPVYLKDTFSSLINETKTQLTANNAQRNAVTFNVVDGSSDGWGLWDMSMNGKTDFNFSELWWKSNNYNDIRGYIEKFRRDSNMKALVLAAYMNYKDNAGDRYEAENAARTNVSVNTNHPGYTGSGFVDGFAEAGDAVTFTISAPETANYPLVFAYANGGSAAVRSLYVDGVKKTDVNFKNTGNWDTWSFDIWPIQNLAAGSHTIKLAYDTGNSGAINLDSLTLGAFNEPSVRLTDAVFAASGASHIELGANKEQTAMLPHEYYPNQSKAMRGSLRSAMMEHYDFITAYENLLYDSDIVFGDGGTQFVNITGQQVSGSGEAGKIWTLMRSKGNYDILHLINLINENDTEWRNVTNTPATLSNLATRYYLGGNETVSGVYIASPDFDQSVSRALTYTTGQDSKGKYVDFTVPSLQYWDMIYIKRTASAPVNGIYEAESNVRTNTTVNTNHAGYTGTGFVDGFAELNDSVSFTVSAATEQEYTFKFRYANATGSKGSRALFVDGQFAGKVYFDSLANWDTWGYGEIGVKLRAGLHQVVLLLGNLETQAINLDHLKVEPKEESARSLYINNWKDTVWLWKDTRINGAQAPLSDGPGLYEMRRYAGGANSDYNTNLIKNYSMFLRNTTDNTKYMTGSNFSSRGWLGSDGILYSQYKTYADSVLNPEITRAYAAIPNQNFTLIKYTVKNTATTSKTFRILDMLHLAASTGGNYSATYDSTNKVVKADMSATGLGFVAYGTLETTIAGYQVANDTVTDINNSACSPWVSFDNNGTLKNNNSISCADISTAMSADVTLAAGAQKDLYFYLAAAPTAAALDTVITTVRGQTGSAWMTSMNTQYTNWLNSGTRATFSDSTLNTAYDRTLIALKQSIVPGEYISDSTTIQKFAAMPAATNPSAYAYKVWARDSAVSAMAMDASGHTLEAEKYWYWLADRQIKTDQGGWKKPGTFWTCYWIWNNDPVSFVEPEYDSIGMFLVGAYRHYEKLSGTAKTSFLNAIWPAYRLSAEFVRMNIQSNGFGAGDCSIWEEQSEYNAFTQALYIAGMDAAQIMAKAKGEVLDSDNYNGAAGTMRTAVQRDSSSSPAGLWDATNKRFMRAVNLDGSLNSKYDSSSDVLIAYGVIDALSSRAKSHIDAVINQIGKDVYGVARYKGDTFYTGKNSWDPGGNEALEDEPSWPQMAMWIGMFEIQSGYDAYHDNALRRLKWYTDRTAYGYMPQGEAVSNVTKKPMISTMVEPITGAAFIMTSLAWLKQFDMRVQTPQYNAGAYKNMTVTTGCANDWDQWWNVPYYRDRLNDQAAADSKYDISRVNISNDANNLYIRIDNAGKTLPAYNAAEKFAVQVYCDDFAGTATKKAAAMNGMNLYHPMAFMIGRWSDSTTFSRFTTDGSNWNFASSITGVTAPQWEPNSGRIELVIPFSQLSSTGNVADGAWANLDIVLSKQTAASTWTEMDSLSIHYRKTGASMEWLKGNLD